MSDFIQVESLKKYFPVEKNLLQRLFVRTKKYVRAVDDIGFSIKKGEILSLVGESGCGKTTTGRLIIRLVEPTTGKILFDGIDIAKLDVEELRSLRRKMQIIFQNPYASFSPRMRIDDAIGHPLEYHGLAEGEERNVRVSEMLEKVGLVPPDQFMKLYPHQISGGQRQRVALARSLVLEPEFVVADEPVSMIDVSLRTTIIDLMLNLRKALGLTYLFITHDLAVANYVSNTLAVMYLGKIVEIGNKEDIFMYPLHPYTIALLSAVPDPNPERKRRLLDLQGEIPSAIDIPLGCRFHTRCPISTEICHREEPPLAPASSSNNHLVACHHPEKMLKVSPC